MKRPRRAGFQALLCACIAAPVSALAQPTPPPPQAASAASVGRVEVVEPALLPGIGVPRERLPYTVERIDGNAIGNRNASSLPELMGQRLPSVNVNEIQGNPFQADINYRGFSASPLLGTPQGLSVFLDGVRVNEAFGDVINWDLLPQAAIADLMLVPGSNPLYGLNTLGAAIAMRTKSGDTHPGVVLETSGGSFGRIIGQFEAGSSFEGGWHAFASGTWFNENGWRDDSPSNVGQLFAKVGRRSADYEFDLSYVGANTDMVGNGLVPQSMLVQSPSVVFTRPDQTKNQLSMLTLAGNTLLQGGAQLAATLYYRNVRTRTLNGDVNNDYRETIEDGAIDVPNAIANRSQTQQSTSGAAVQWSLSTAGHQATAGAAYDGSRSRFQQGRALGDFDATRAVIETEVFEIQNSLNGQVDNFGLYATDTLTLAPQLFLTLSGRYNLARVTLQDTGPSAPALDGNHRYSSFNPAVGAAYEWTPGITLYGGFAQGSRAPSPIELGCADPANPCTLPNALASDPPLNQVVTRTFELGLRGRVDDIRWNAGLFQAINRNDILFVGTTTSAGYFTNFGKTRRQGLELAASGHSGPLEWSASYSYIQATYQSNACIVSQNNSTRGSSLACSPQVPTDPSVYLGGDLIAVTPGARLPGVPTQSLKLIGSYAVDERWRVGAQVVAFSSLFVRGNENNLHKPGTATDLNGVTRDFLGPGYAPGYGVLNLSTRYAVSHELELYARVANVLNRQYATAGALAENPFDSAGTFQPDPQAWSRETFYAPGAPRAAWVGLRYRF